MIIVPPPSSLLTSTSCLRDIWSARLTSRSSTKTEMGKQALNSLGLDFVDADVSYFSFVLRLRKEEISALSGPNEFAEFYSRLRTVKEFHRKHPNEIQVPMSVEFDELNRARENPSEEMMSMFHTFPYLITDAALWLSYVDAVFFSCFFSLFTQTWLSSRMKRVMESTLTFMSAMRSTST